MEIVSFTVDNQLVSGKVVLKEEDRMLVEYKHPNIIGTGYKYIKESDVQDILCF